VITLTDDNGFEQPSDGASNAGESLNTNWGKADKGHTFNLELGADMTEAQVGYIDGSGEAQKAIASATDTSYAIGFLTEDGSAGASRYFRHFGRITNTNWDFSAYIGKPIYLDWVTAGAVTTQESGDPNKRVDLGIVATTDTILCKINAYISATAGVQSVYKTITGDSGSTTADSANDSLAILGGNGIATVSITDQITMSLSALSTTWQAGSTKTIEIGTVLVDTLTELTADNGIDIETVHLEDGALSNVSGLTMTGNITMPEDGWIGIGSGSERIVFDGDGNTVNVMGASFGIGRTATALFDIYDATNDIDYVIETDKVNGQVRAIFRNDAQDWRIGCGVNDEFFWWNDTQSEYGMILRYPYAGVGSNLSNPLHFWTIDQGASQVRGFQLVQNSTGRGSADGFTMVIDNSKNLWINQRENANMYWYANSNLCFTFKPDGNVAVNNVMLVDHIAENTGSHKITLDDILLATDAIYLTQTDGAEKIDSDADNFLDFYAGTASRFHSAIYCDDFYETTADHDIHFNDDTFMGSGVHAYFGGSKELSIAYDGASAQVTASGAMYISSTALGINADTIFSNGKSVSLYEDLTWLGATTQNLAKFPDNLAVALRFAEGANPYFDFVSTDAAERMEAHKPIVMKDPGSLLGTPLAGAIEYDAGRLYITNVCTQKAIDRTSDVAVSTVTVANTTTETTIWTAGMDADCLVAGNAFMMHADGTIDSASAADTITLRVKVGGVTMATLVSGAKQLTGAHWHLDANATQRTIGATGSRAIHLDLIVDEYATVVIGLGTVDTTANMNITLTAQWNNAKAGNTVSLLQGFMRFKN